MKKEIKQSEVSGPPLLESLPSADKKTRVVRFEVSPATMSPAVTWMETRRVKRWLAIAIVFTLLFVVATLVLTLTIPTLVSQASALVEQVSSFRIRLSDYLARSNLTVPLADWLRNFKYNVTSSAISATAFAFSMRIFEITAYGASAIFLALYIMIDRDRLRGGLFAVVPRSHHISASPAS